MPANGMPKPGPRDVNLKDDHLQYAITWFAPAGAVAIAFGGLVASEAAGFVSPGRGRLTEASACGRFA
jgi:cytochrome oxidase assembly protein ShyY1